MGHTDLSCLSSDLCQASWEPEEHVPEELISLFKQQNPELFKTRVAAANDEAPVAWPDLMGEYQTQAGGSRLEVSQAMGVAA